MSKHLAGQTSMKPSKQDQEIHVKKAKKQLRQREQRRLMQQYYQKLEEEQKD